MTTGTTYKSYRLVMLLMGLVTLWSLNACEDLIELDLNEAEPLIVIAGEVSNVHMAHQIKVHRTVSVYAEQLLDPVSGATVEVQDDQGNRFVYEEITPGVYESQRWRGRIGREYTMQVEVEGELYTARSTMHEPVPVDSVGLGKNSFMGQENFFVSLKFNDPPQSANYYRYLMRVNQEPFRFIAIFDDKFNNGNAVSHDIYVLDHEIQPGDQISVHKQHVDYPVFRYWQRIGFANPAEAVPANPPSNIQGGALGYFSAYSLQEFEILVEENL